MHILQRDVTRVLTGLSHHAAPPEGDPLFQFVQESLEGIEIDLLRVKRLAQGQFVAKWNRKGGALTEETTFTLVERPFVKSWN